MILSPHRVAIVSVNSDSLAAAHGTPSVERPPVEQPPREPAAEAHARGRLHGRRAPSSRVCRMPGDALDG
jgi:hypothetical protein